MRCSRAGLFFLIVLIAASPGCAEKTVLLEYRFPPGYEGRYRWTVHAVTQTESPTEQTTNEKTAVLELRETVRREPGGRIILTVRLDPLSAREDGETASVPPSSTAEYEIDSRGRIRKLVRADLSAGAISSLELDTLVSQVRPQLSAGPVQLGGRWDAPLVIKGERTAIDFKGAGRLIGFDLADRRRLARIETRRRGDITSAQMLNNSRVVLQGESSSRVLSKLDLDRGTLFSSDNRSTSTFDVLVSERRAARLTVQLSSRLRLEKSR